MKRDQILAHRGWWSEPSEKNSEAALRSALDAGFGIETDFRDLNGVLVISHDPPLQREANCTAKLFFDMVNNLDRPSRLALNVKADGLQTLIREAMGNALVSKGQAYVFDMSVPDALLYFREGFPSYTRLSEYEAQASFADSAEGVWIDNFLGDYPQVATAKKVLDSGKRAAIVSPELHGRAHLGLWAEIINAKLHTHPCFELCTDFPEDAAQYFGAEL